MRDPLSTDAIRDLLCELIRIPSVNPAIAPEEGGGERAIAAYARDWLERARIRAWLDEAAPGRPNVVAEIGDRDPTLILCAHLDTVGTSGMTIAPFAGITEDGRVYGRGSYDMKGSVAAILAASAALRQSPPGGRVLVALVADEEYASAGAADFVQRYRADACVVTEPAEGQLVLAHKGFVWATVTTSGHAAHGSRWDLGVSAIEKMARVITALEAFDRAELRKRTHPLVGPASMHCAMVHGGVGLSTYAPSCELQIERRTLPGEAASDVGSELERVVRSADPEALVTCFFDRAPFVCGRDEPVARCVSAAVAKVTGRAPAVGGVGFWMDAAIFAAAGIPTVNYGPSGAGAHEAVEWVDLASVATCAQVYVEAAWRFCAGERI